MGTFLSLSGVIGKPHTAMVNNLTNYAELSKGSLQLQENVTNRVFPQQRCNHFN